MWFFVVKRRTSDNRRITTRTRSSLMNIIDFLLSTPFKDWRDIETVKIERLDK